MAKTTFSGPVRSESTIKTVSKNSSTGVITEVTTFGDSPVALGDENKTLTKESLLLEYPEIVEEIRQAAVEEDVKNSERVALVEAIENDIKEKDAKLDGIQSENDDLRSKLDDYETREKVSARKARIDTAIAESGLDKEFCSDVFVEDLMKLDEDEAIQARIADRKALVETAHGEITDNGERPDQVETKESQKTEMVLDESQFINSIAQYDAKA